MVRLAPQGRERGLVRAPQGPELEKNEKSKISVGGGLLVPHEHNFFKLKIWKDNGHNGLSDKIILMFQIWVSNINKIPTRADRYRKVLLAVKTSTYLLKLAKKMEWNIRM